MHGNKLLFLLIPLILVALFASKKSPPVEDLHFSPNTIPTKTEPLPSPALELPCVARGSALIVEKILSYGPDTPTEIEMELQGIRIGDWRIISVPGELYTEIGLSIKALAPGEKVLISEQTNGRYGYIPPDSTLGTTAYGGRYYAGDLGYGTKEKMLNVSGALLDAIK